MNILILVYEYVYYDTENPFLPDVFHFLPIKPILCYLPVESQQMVAIDKRERKTSG